MCIKKVILGDFCSKIDYWIGKDYWNRGYAAEAVERMLAYGFGPFGLNLIFRRSFPNNPAFFITWEEAGLIYEGRLRQELWHELQQEFKDLLVFSILWSECEAAQAL
ncbi:MAG TPA: GNAT family protein [Aggregatilineaceae bacterium]|nr:GNAT family protein [Aggregatilineaceae bacterium]